MAEDPREGESCTLWLRPATHRLVTSPSPPLALARLSSRTTQWLALSSQTSHTLRSSTPSSRKRSQKAPQKIHSRRVKRTLPGLPVRGMASSPRMRIRDCSRLRRSSSRVSSHWVRRREPTIHPHPTIRALGPFPTREWWFMLTMLPDPSTPGSVNRECFAITLGFELYGAPYSISPR